MLSRSEYGEGHVGIRESGQIGVELPGVREDGMSGKNAQRKLGTTRGSPRRSRTAKALRISRLAAKSRCACEWGGWGRLSDDGPGQNNPDPSEGPWGGGRPIHQAVHCQVRTRRSTGPLSGPRGARKAEANQMLDGACREQASATNTLRRPRPKCQPSSRTGENPPYGMTGRIEETSASFEARSAPRSYPTPGTKPHQTASGIPPRPSELCQ